MKKETYCLVCKKYTENAKPKIVINRQNRLMIQSLDLLKNKKHWEY